MSKTQDLEKVQISNAGHAFHVMWTARRCLRLFDPHSNLKAIVIEGVTPSEKVITDEMAVGLLKVDTAEYYGGEDFETASSVHHLQLKYSPTKPNEEWKAGEITDVFKAFSQLFKEMCSDYGEKKTLSTARFYFVTNRPIAITLSDALNAAKNRKLVAGNTKRALRSLRNAASVLTDKQFQKFARVFEFNANEADYATQEWELNRGVYQYLAGQDTTAPVMLEKLVRERGLHTNNQPITRSTLLLVFGGGLSQESLFPARPSLAFKPPSIVVPRNQEAEIADKIIKDPSPAIIHATGGVGKSVLALRLPSMMPSGTESVVFDGFADGLYRQPNQPRHKHDHALVQIANEFASRGYCDLLIPTPAATTAQYLNAFLHRLNQTVIYIRRNSPDALVLVVLDAADNSQMAADDNAHGNSFVRDLLKIKQYPEGCRIVALARTERFEELLKPKSFVKTIPLEPFTLDETAINLSNHYPRANNRDIYKFHRLTSSNPRVQANALDGRHNLQEVLRNLGPNPLGVSEMINYQLQTAVDRIREEASSPEDIENLCIALAALPPLVPIPILAKAARISPALVHSFISDLGRPLLEVDDAVHFRDEPVEMWFREQFSRTEQYGRLIDAIYPLATEDSYISSALPRLLWQAGRVNDLMNLAVDDKGLPDDSVERRQIVLRRVQFALRAAVKEERFLDVTKLAIRAGEEVASNGRQRELFLNNPDLIVALGGIELAREIVFRNEVGNWKGMSFANAAAILACDSHFHAEASSMLDCAQEWLGYWLSLPKEERSEESFDDYDIAAMAFAHLHLNGPEALAEDLSRWKPDSVSYTAGSIIIRRLVDAGEFDLILKIAAAAKASPYLILAVVEELASVSKIAPIEPIDIAIKAFLKNPPKKSDNTYGRDSIENALISLAEAAAQLRYDQKTLLKFLSKLKPPIPKWGLASRMNEYREPVLRSYCLEAALKGNEINLEDFAHESIVELVKDQSKNDHPDVREFKATVGVVLPIYKLRAEAIANPTKRRTINKQLQMATKKMYGVTTSDEQKTYTTNEFFPLWLDLLIRANKVDSSSINQLIQWAEEQNIFLYIPKKTKLIRTIARSTNLPDIAEKLAAELHALLKEEREDAVSMAESYLSIARALLSINKTEAKFYFEEAQRVSGRFGDETNERWSTITALAHKARDNQKPEAELAFRYARSGEAVSKYVYDHFQWGSTISGVASLCPSSGFTILSRWRDRDVGRFDVMLPCLVEHLLEEELLSPALAITFHALQPQWYIPDFAELLLKKETDADEQRKILGLLVHHIQIEGKWDDAIKLKAIASEYNLADPDLNEIAKFAENRVSPPPDKEPAWYAKKTSEDIKTINWSSILGNKEHLSPEEIDAAYLAIKPLRPYYPFLELMERIRKQVPAGQEIMHLQAIVHSKELSAGNICHALEEAKKHWHNKMSVQNAFGNIVLNLLRFHSLEIITYWHSLDYRFQELVSLSGLCRDVLIKSLIQGATETIDEIDSKGFYALAHELADQSLTPADAKTALDYALHRVEMVLEGEDADGQWGLEIHPPERVVSAVAGFLYAQLGLPKTASRWEGAHMVRRLAYMNQREALNELVSFIKYDTKTSVFTDRRLPFYHLHARLYLLIALAYLAKKHPDMVQAHANIFEHFALNDLPHVLIQKISVDAALDIEKAFPGTFTKSILDAFSCTNKSSFPPDDNPQFKASDRKWRKDARFSFYLDFGPYWLEPLARVFGMPTDQVENMTEGWIIDKWHIQTEGKWVNDVRADLGLYPRSRSGYPDTHHSQGSYPVVDSHSFYLSYHAMFCVAGELLQQYPIAKPEYWYSEDNMFEDWLNGHNSTTRSDGIWLSDLRGPTPLLQRDWEGDANSDNWCWEITTKDFDFALHMGTQKLNLWGDWTFVNGSRIEAIEVHSALVDRKTSFALLKAWQTSEELNHFHIPIGDDFNRTKIEGFNVRSPVLHSEPRHGMDSFDPYAANLPSGFLQPALAPIKLCKLKPDVERKLWYNDQDYLALEVETWGDWKEIDTPNSHGRHMSGDIPSILRLLENVERDMIIEVVIRRRDRHSREDKHDQNFYTKQYCRIYLLRPDGTLQTITKRHKLREIIN